jgi:hypothetical protein
MKTVLLLLIAAFAMAILDLISDAHMRYLLLDCPNI